MLTEEYSNIFIILHIFKPRVYQTIVLKQLRNCTTLGTGHGLIKFWQHLRYSHLGLLEVHLKDIGYCITRHPLYIFHEKDRVLLDLTHVPDDSSCLYIQQLVCASNWQNIVIRLCVPSEYLNSEILSQQSMWVPHPWISWHIWNSHSVLFRLS